MLSNITHVDIAASFFSILPISSFGATVGCIVFKVRAVALIVVCLLFSQTLPKLLTDTRATLLSVLKRWIKKMKCMYTENVNCS